MSAGRKRDAKEASFLLDVSPQATLQLQNLMSIDSEVRKYSDHRALAHSTPSVLNRLWRERVAQWFFDVVDHLGLPRETVYLAMNILDRYNALNSNEESSDKLSYELAAITSLFLAVRVSGAMDLKIPELLQLSHSSAQVRDILSTGAMMLELLTWESRILTPVDFIKVLLALLKPSIDCRRAILLYELSLYIVELSIFDQTLCGVPAPRLAFAAVLLAIKSVDECNRDRKAFTQFLLKVHDVTRMSYRAADIKAIYIQLRSLYSESQDSCTQNFPCAIPDEDDSNIVHTVQSSPDFAALLKRTQASSNVIDIVPVCPLQNTSNKRARLV